MQVANYFVDKSLVPWVPLTQHTLLARHREDKGCILTSMEALEIDEDRDTVDRVSLRFMKRRCLKKIEMRHQALAKGLDWNLARFWLSGTILPKTCAH